MLRGASAEAQAELTSELEGSKGDADKLVEELFGVAAVLRGEPAVRRILTDASVEPDAKASLAGDVFGNALGETATELVKSAVKRRWTVSHDLADVIEELGVLAAVRSAGDDGSKISDELFEVRRVVDETAGSAYGALGPVAVGGGQGRAAAHPVRGEAAARDDAAGRAGGRRSGTAPSTGRSRCSSTPRHTPSARRSRPCTPPGSSPTTSAAGWPSALGAQYDTTIHLLVVQDPKIVGGIRVEIGDDVIDGTVASKLEDAQESSQADHALPGMSGTQDN